MGATKLLILENSLGQKVRTFAAHSEFLNLVYINDTRRVEAYATLTKLDADKVSYKLIQKIEVKKMSADGLVLKNLGTIRPLTDSAVNSPSYELPEQQDEENLKEKIQKIQNALAKIKESKDSIAGNSDKEIGLNLGTNSDILGFSQEQWNNFFHPQ